MASSLGLGLLFPNHYPAGRSLDFGGWEGSEGPVILNFLPDLTHSHHVPGRNSKYDLYFTNGRKGSPNRISSLRSRVGHPSLLISLSHFSAPVPFGVAPEEVVTNDCKYGSQSPRQVGTSVRVALEVSGPSPPPPGPHPFWVSHFPSSLCPAQMIHHLSLPYSPVCCQLDLQKQGPVGGSNCTALS